MDVAFGQQSYQHRSLPLSAQRMVNCYVEKPPEGSKGFLPNLQSYGIVNWKTIGTGPMRGGHVVDGVPYVVSGTYLYRVELERSIILGVIPGGDIVDITSDGTNVLVVTSRKTYLWNGFVFSEVTDVDFPGAGWCEYLDGYAVIGEPSTGRAWINETVGDWSSWNALDFATAEGWPDDTLDGISDHRELFLLGRETIEVWYNSGNSDFPLERVSTGFIEKGVLCKGAVQKHDNTLFFPGHDGIVYRLEGYTPVRISTHAIEQKIEALSDKTLRGMVWVEGGHAFYALTSSDWTIVYDISTGLWHERESDDLSYWRPLKILRAFDRWIVLDSLSARMGFLSDGVFTEWGQTLRSSATAPAVSQENRWIFHSRLELVFEQGVGAATGQGVNPQVMLDWSDDGGRTWSSERWRGLGAAGQFDKRTVWNRLGRARDRVYRYAISDPVRRTLIQATLDAEIGAY